MSVFNLSLALGALLGGLAVDHVATAGALWAGGALALLAVPLLRAGRGTRVRV
ncbi:MULTISPECIES: hypothetical protein [unclassified Streptomyces]|uniref:hypothetical protein n=1 Tax=unclassified Streptomyces TaxID=2593676 RepID=UPI00380FFB9C